MAADDTFYKHLFVESYLNIPSARRNVLAKVKAAMARTDTPATSIDLGVSAGGFTGPTGQSQAFDIGRNVRKIDVSYDMFGIPDAMDIRFRNKVVASTGGPVSGTGVLHARLPIAADDHSDEVITVTVFGTDPGTAWNYAVQCP